MIPFTELGRDIAVLTLLVAAGLAGVSATSQRWRAMRVRKQTREWVDWIEFAFGQDVVCDGMDGNTPLGLATGRRTRGR